MSRSLREVWFTGDGRVVDLAEELQRDDPDMVRFALHSLGWVQLRDNDPVPGFGIFAREPVEPVEIRLDPRAVESDAINRLGDALLTRRMDLFPRAAERFVVWLFKFGEWKRETAGTALEAIKLVEESAMAAQSGVVPSTVVSCELEIEQLNHVGRGLDSFAVPFKIWRLGGGRADDRLFRAFNERGLFLGRTKVLYQNRDHEIIVSHYGPGHPLWSRDQWVSFVGRSIRAVPDHVLGSQVEKTCRSALTRFTPLFERCSGVIMAFDGPRKCQWLRLTLPCLRRDRQGARTPDTLIVITESERPGIPVS